MSFHTGLPSNYGEIHAGFYNGEGYSKSEANDQKAFQVRATVRPMATSSSLAARGLRVTIFYDADHYLQNAERRRLVANATFEHARFNTGFDYYGGKDQISVNASDVESKGWSFWITPFVKEKGNGLEGLLRIDRFKPNSTTLDSQRKQRIIAGIAYWFPHPGGAGTAALLLDFEQVTFDGFPSTAANAQQQKIALHGLISF